MGEQARSAPSASAGPRGRVRVFDVWRGISVISMVLFHYCYDLRYLSGMSLPWFAPPLQDIWRASISWSFIFIAGCMCPLSRNNLKRGGVYALFAVGIFAVTSLAAVDTPISFGVIYCMAACTLVEWVLERLGARPHGYLAAFLLFLAFLLCLGLPDGTVGIGPVQVALPHGLYSTEWLSWLGIPGPRFASGDYYPLLPYLLLYLAGTSCGSLWHERGYPSWAYGNVAKPLQLVGRHALLVYVLHQPVLLLLSGNLL